MYHIFPPADLDNGMVQQCQGRAIGGGPDLLNYPSPPVPRGQPPPRQTQPLQEAPREQRRSILETITTLSVTENIARPQFKHNPDNEHREKAISLRKHVKLTLSEGLLIDQRVSTPLRTCLPSAETYTTSD